MRVKTEAELASERERDQSWDVYGMFGFALFCAQLLEDQLREICDLPEPAIVRWPEYKNDSKGTMGELVGEAKKIIQDKDIVERLDEALRLRNYLAHHFFSSQRRTREVPDNRKEMMQECGMAADRFRSLTEALAQSARGGELP